MNVVVDTNVIVSGLISTQGFPAQVLDKWLQDDFTLLYSEEMIGELTSVLYREWMTRHLTGRTDRRNRIIKNMRLKGQLVSGYTDVTGEIRDPFDEMFLMCAVLGQADYLVSGDKDLLTLTTFHQTQIVTPKQFIEVLAGQ